MKITKEKAIEILQNQYTKIDKLNSDNFDVWRTDIASYIRIFFGEESNERAYINWRNFDDIKDKIPQLKTFVENCIEKINNVGLAKKEWNHFLTKIDPILLWSIFASIIALSFFAGKFWATWHTK